MPLCEAYPLASTTVYQQLHQKMAFSFSTAPDKQGRVALAFVIDSNNILNRKSCAETLDDTWFFPFGRDVEDDEQTCGVNEYEVIVCAREPFGSAPGVGATLTPAFTNLAGLAVSTLRIRDLRDSEGMFGTDDDLAREIIYRSYVAVGIVGTKAAYNPTTGDYVSQFSGDVSGITQFFNFSKRRINFWDRLEWRLPERDELKRERIEGLVHHKKVYAILDRAEMFGRRSEKFHIIRKLRLDSVQGLGDPFARVTRITDSANATTFVYAGGAAMIDRDMFGESYRDHVSYAAFLGMRVLAAKLRNTPLDQIDLEKLSGMVDLQSEEDMRNNLLSLDEQDFLQHRNVWQSQGEQKVYAHRALLAMSMGVGVSQVYSKSTEDYSRRMQKSGCLRLLLRGSEAQSRLLERDFGVCARACNKNEKGDVFIRKPLRI